MKQNLILYIILQLVFTKLIAQEKALTFEHILPKQGLSHRQVNCIVQDNEGYMWFGTWHGLNRYDGHNFKVYEHDPYNSNSISDNHIRLVYEDRAKDLWIATPNGLNKYNKATDTFTIYKHNPQSPHSISDNDILAILEDHQGVLWIGTKLGLNKYDRQRNTFTLYEHLPKHIKTWDHNTIHTIYQDINHTLWVGTTQGLSKFDRASGKFTRLKDSSQTADTLIVVTSIIEDEPGILWVGTKGDGLKKFDTKTSTFTVFRHNPADANSISNNLVVSLFKDSFGTIWTGNQLGGLNRFDKTRGTFTHHMHDANNASTISDDIIPSIYEDRSKVLWIGTFTGGVNKVDLLRKKISHYEHNPKATATSLRNNFVRSIYQDRFGEIWVGNAIGIDKFDKQKGSFTHYTYGSKLSQNLGNNSAHCIYEDKAANLWVGLSGEGLKRLDRVSNKFVSYKHSPQDSTSLVNNFISSIHQDKMNTLWIGTREGISKFDPLTEKFTNYRPPFLHPNVEYILEDASGVLWLATKVSGLVKFDAKHSSFTHYPIKIKNLEATSSQRVSYIYEDKKGILWLSLEGGGVYIFNRNTFTYSLATKALSKVYVVGILEDSKGNLFLATRKNGIYRFNPETKSLQNYDVFDGLQSNEFERALCKGRDGEMYFGSNNGFDVFHPDSLHNNPYPPQVAISNFTVFDKPRTFSDNKIVLPYSDNFFSFEFAALTYALPAKNKYAYLLESVDKDWVQAGTRRYASYTNVEPGEYIFRVKATNHDGLWNEKGIAVTISILPPLWRTPWAYLLYFLSGCGLLYASYRYLTARERYKHTLQLKEVESAKLREMDKVKSRFFANISHEFRTPLTLILGPLQKLRTTVAASNQENGYMDMMERNANRLLQLINQLLDLSKLESGLMSLQARPLDIVQHLRAILYSFTSLAETKGIELKFVSQIESIEVYLEEDKLEKIIYNLLSNACKFTKQGGSISVSICPAEERILPASGLWGKKQQEYIQVKVQDTGIGIAGEQLEKIFNRFYQVDNSSTREQEGTGIGLALTRELVELQGGRISVTSELGKGTTFFIFFPLGKAHLRTDQLATAEPQSRQASLQSLSKQASETYPAVGVEAASSQNESVLPLLLIAEDNKDVRDYIKDTFAASYRCLEAIDGEQALTLAIEHVPNIVISDLMMPKMNGLQLCEKLKTDQRTSHIPLILLTAKASLEDKLEGLNTGADDYLTKPFYPFELQIRVRNLIKQRQLLSERFSKGVKVEPKELSVTSADEQFLIKAIAIVEEHIAEPEFSAEQFSEEMCMSRMQLHRKLKAMTDQSTTDFVRTLRLKRAAQLIERGYGTITQISYEVGITNPSHLSKHFKEMFGCSPSQYADRFRKTSRQTQA